MFTQLLFSFGGFAKPFLMFTGYISSTNSFPKPLTKEEEEYYLQLYKKGERL